MSFSLKSLAISLFVLALFLLPANFNHVSAHGGGGHGGGGGGGHGNWGGHGGWDGHGGWGHHGDYGYGAYDGGYFPGYDGYVGGYNYAPPVYYGDYYSDYNYYPPYNAQYYDGG